jgi:hypothetical protein
MQYLGTEDEMQQVWDNLLAQLTPEDRAIVLAHASSEERLAGIPIEELLAGIPAEELLRGLTPEELERLRHLLQTPPKADDSERPL